MTVDRVSAFPRPATTPPGPGANGPQGRGRQQGVEYPNPGPSLPPAPVPIREVPLPDTTRDGGTALDFAGASLGIHIDVRV